MVLTPPHSAKEAAAILSVRELCSKNPAVQRSNELYIGSLMEKAQNAYKAIMPSRLDDWPRKDVEKLYKYSPRFNESADGSFSDSVRETINFIARSGVNIYDSSNYMDLKNVFYFSVPEGRAKNLMRGRYNLVEDSNVSYIQYLTICRSILEPPISSTEYFQSFTDRRQLPRETVREYVSAKQTLFMKCYPDYQPHDFNLFNTLREETVSGLLNPALRERAAFVSASTPEALSDEIVMLATNQLFLHKMGEASGTRDGLLSASAAKASRQGHDVSRVGQVNAFTSYGDGKNKSNQGQRRGQCWDCGSLEHFQRSPQCPQPGARKYHPGPQQKNGNRQGGRRGRGNRGGRKNNYSKPSVNSVEEAPAGGNPAGAHEESFLGNTGPEPQAL